MMRRFLSLLLLVGSAAAFVPPATPIVLSFSSKALPPTADRLSTSLAAGGRSPRGGTFDPECAGRQWNFNGGRSPWGMKANAEIWNGRLAQIGFVIVVLQEAITGKGAIEGLQGGDLFSYVMLGLTGVSILGLTAWLAFKGDENDIVF